MRLWFSTRARERTKLSGRARKSARRTRGGTPGNGSPCRQNPVDDLNPSEGPRSRPDVAARAAANDYRAALKLMEQGDLEGGRDLLLRAIAEKPDFGEAFNALGSLYRQTGNREEAERIYRAATEAASNHPYPHLNLALLYFDSGRAADAIPFLETAIRLEPDLPQAHFLHGDCLRDAGRKADAESAYLRAAALKPNFFEAHFNLAMLYRSQNRHADAAAAFETCRKLDPNHRPAVRQLGHMLLELGQFENGLRAVVYGEGALELAIEPDVKFSIIGDSLGAWQVDVAQKAPEVLEFTPA
jgi:tetratricopeptide (TPR) repeat protein